MVKDKPQAIKTKAENTGKKIFQKKHGRNTEERKNFKNST